ncbi:discoidin domain-containing protein [Nocardioides speluncae]|uniref:discoidin domain-containing protein n=1 Tax=Nocardioides speluncae TaxID=2670337 RepID=UPI000D69E0BC|nr:discoidin domain-containing protein [Nocardioides speluncae]
MTRIFSGLAIVMICLATCLQAAPAQAQAADRNPVIFVHGYGGAASDVSAIKPNLIAEGYADGDIYSLDFANDIRNEDVAAKLSTLVDQVRASSGAAKVDLIGFSMGGLSSRYYLKNLGGDAKVGHFASIAGPNHGTSQASFCFIITSDPACPQMAPGSSFLNALNSGDETPGSTAYATWVSTCDNVINPPTSTPLAGAENHTTAGCFTHIETLQSPEVAKGVAEFFGGAGTTPPPTSSNLALNKAATGSTACASSERPAKAVNGSVSGGNSDKFCSSGNAGWLQVDLGATKEIEKLVVKHAQSGGEPAHYNTRAFTIAVSDDGRAWRTVTTVTANAEGTSSHPVTVSGRYVRLNVTASVQSGAPWPATRIYELEVIGR